ncbi:MAG: sugar transferase [Prevotella sp.]|nr:sugar transferase [Prevotella sp.]
MYKNFFKRAIDFTIVFIALLIIWPILAIITLWLHFANKDAGAFYPSTRVGRNGKEFSIYKFRSMTDERDSNWNLLPDEERLTSIGKFIRATSIDELPQLVNVLKGDMSLIGPRPLPALYLQLYTPEQARRLEVRPGITGWAQVNGRQNCKLSKKFQHDLWYVDNCTFWIDIKILFKTVYNVLGRKDIGEGVRGFEEMDDIGILDLVKKNQK